MASPDLIDFHCDHCGRRIRATASSAGKRFTCPNSTCGTVLTVPTASVQTGRPSSGPNPESEKLGADTLLEAKSQTKRSDSKPIDNTVGNAASRKKPHLFFGSIAVSSLALVGVMIVVVQARKTRSPGFAQKAPPAERPIARAQAVQPAPAKQPAPNPAVVVAPEFKRVAPKKALAAADARKEAELQREAIRRQQERLLDAYALLRARFLGDTISTIRRSSPAGSARPRRRRPGRC